MSWDFFIRKYSLVLCDDGNAATCQTWVVSAVNPAPAKKTERVYGMKVSVKWEAIFTVFDS